MISMSYIPNDIRILFRGLPGLWKSRHFLLFVWLVILQAICPGRKTLKGMSAFAPTHITEWRFRRLLTAGYWSVHALLLFYADQVMAALPKPDDEILHLFGDGSGKPKCGKKNPVARKGRKSKDKPFFFGIRFVVPVAHWDVYGIPVDFRIILPGKHPNYKKEDKLPREMARVFRVPEWARTVIVGGDRAYASKENMQPVRNMDKSDSKRKWGFVFAIAKTWNRTNGKSLRDLAYHLPRKSYKKTWIPRLPQEKSRKTFRIFGKRLSLNHIGDVTIVLTRKGRNVGPGKTRLLVTNLTELSPRQVVCIYNRRWSVGILFKEPESGLGLGQHQVTGNEKRIENSIGIAIFAYLFLILARKNDIKPFESWSIFQLRNNLWLDIIVSQTEHNTKLKMKKLLKAS